MFAQLKKEKNARASVVDGKLILSFPEAITPIVWQMDLADAKSSSFEVTQEEGTFALVTKKQGAAKKDVIAPFHNKEDAVTALMATSSALENAHGQIRVIGGNSSAGHLADALPQVPHHNSPSYYAAPAHKKTGGAFKWIIGLVILFVLVTLIVMTMNMRPRIPASVDNAAGLNAPRASAPETSGNAAEQAGVPVSADDFLNAR